MEKYSIGIVVREYVESATYLAFSAKGRRFEYRTVNNPIIGRPVHLALSYI